MPRNVNTCQVLAFKIFFLRRVTQINQEGKEMQYLDKKASLLEIERLQKFYGK